MIDTDHLDAMAAAFTALGRLHQRPPDALMLSSLWELLEDWPVPQSAATSTGLDHMRASRDGDEDAEVIRRDHARLYGHTAVAKVSPYESVHRGQDGLVFDEETMQVREAYRALSLEAPKLNKEPDDHIGLELDFIAQACLKALDALDLDSSTDADRYLSVGNRFFDEHLMQWAPSMLKRAAREADTHFMKGICHLTLGAFDAYGDLVASV